MPNLLSRLFLSRNARMMKAVRVNDFELVEKLLAQGADPDHIPNEHDTDNPPELSALHIAARQGNPECVETLLRHGATINGLNNCGETELGSWFAGAHRYMLDNNTTELPSQRIEVGALLLEHGATIGEVNIVHPAGLAPRALIERNPELLTLEADLLSLVSQRQLAPSTQEAAGPPKARRI